jgi:hypothetical protein
MYPYQRVRLLADDQSEQITCVYLDAAVLTMLRVVIVARYL